jgi:hypothetical protein
MLLWFEKPGYCKQRFLYFEKYGGGGSATVPWKMTFLLRPAASKSCPQDLKWR